VHFVRQGTVGTFLSGDGSVDSIADFVALAVLAAKVVVVNQINWCDGIKPGIIGCSPTPGSYQVVTRYNPVQPGSAAGSLEGILWAHEYGHTKGLPHRNNIFAVMNPYIGSTERQVNTTECTMLHN
jgi:hypothetical protein